MESGILSEPVLDKEDLYRSMETELSARERKKAFVTGASRGIGAQIARLLAEEGYDLFLVCRQSEAVLAALGRELEEIFPVSVETMLCDVSDFRQVEEAVGRAGDVHVLVNNAAVSHVGLMTDMTLEQWQQVIDTNLNALFYTCRLIVPQMVRRQEGHIINISSVWGKVGASMEVAYSAAKGGVNAFTRALAKELAPSRVRVNAAAFGAIDTEMNACFSKEELQALREEIPADRLGTALEAAKLVAGLLKMPEYLTGQVITMDGGWI